MFGRVCWSGDGIWRVEEGAFDLGLWRGRHDGCSFRNEHCVDTDCMRESNAGKEQTTNARRARGNNHDELRSSVGAPDSSHLIWYTTCLILSWRLVRYAIKCRLVLVMLMSRTSQCPPPWPSHVLSAAHRSHPHSRGGGRSFQTWFFLRSQIQLCSVSNACNG